ncbi:MAG: transcription elongation factor GreA [Dehalococcoidia bacterium]
MYERRVLLTQDGIKRLEAELHELRTVRRADVAQQIRDAQELGMTETDGQYEEAKNQQAFLEGRIQEIEKMLEMAEVIDEGAAHGSKEVRIGSTVSLRTTDNKRRKYQLVGAAETNPSEGRISDESPLGQALLGKKRGETVKIQAPGGTVEMTITSIS